MTKRRRSAILLLGALALGWTTGCASTPVPRRLNRSERQLVQETKLPLVLGIRPSSPPGYAARLATALRRTGMFEEVALIPDLQRQPDLIAIVEQNVYGTATIPLFTILTLGIVPTFVRETHGYLFSLHSAKAREPSVMVDLRYSGATTLGWFAALQNLSPNRIYGDPYKSERINDALAAAIAARAAEIRGLAEPRP